MSQIVIYDVSYIQLEKLEIFVSLWQSATTLAS